MPRLSGLHILSHPSRLLDCRHRAGTHQPPDPITGSGPSQDADSDRTDRGTSAQPQAWTPVVSSGPGGVEAVRAVLSVPGSAPWGAVCSRTNPGKSEPAGRGGGEGQSHAFRDKGFSPKPKF